MGRRIALKKKDYEGGLFEDKLYAKTSSLKSLLKLWVQEEKRSGKSWIRSQNIN